MEALAALAVLLVWALPALTHRLARPHERSAQVFAFDDAPSWPVGVLPETRRRIIAEEARRGAPAQRLGLPRVVHGREPGRARGRAAGGPGRAA